MRKYFLFFILLTFFSCVRKSDTSAELILGNWVEVKKKPGKNDIDLPPPPGNDTIGYEFKQNGICEFKNGYYDWNKFYNDTVTDRETRVIQYLGAETKYKISKKSLRIFNPASKKWDAFGISKITKDTLILKNYKGLITFSKNIYNTSKVPDFDAIIVSSSSCYGACPANEIMISKKGDVLYKGNFYVKKKGWYTSKIAQSQFKKISERFQKANYMVLKDDYYTTVTDNRSVSVSFIKNGKIFKTIEDYADSAPKELIWAYVPVTMLAQKLDLNPKQVTPFLSNTIFNSSLTTGDNLKSMELTASEGFYLVSLLLDAKVTNATFNDNYDWSYSTPAVTKITTDGRYYKIRYIDDKIEIRDIGFNFITENKLKNKLETIKN